jgi:hypothetical protein
MPEFKSQLGTPGRFFPLSESNEEYGDRPKRLPWNRFWCQWIGLPLKDTALIISSIYFAGPKT